MRSLPRKSYPSFAAASAVCADGYQQADLVGSIVEKTRRMERNRGSVSPSQAFGIASLLKARPARVIDFGGAAGAHYLFARPFIDWPLTWRVVETPEMVRQASPLADDTLSFSETLDLADFIWTSGTLQCVESPHEWLAKLLMLNAEHIYFGRMGLSKGQDVFAIHRSKLSHNGHGPLPDGFKDRAVRYAFSFPAEGRFMAAILDRYEVVARFDDASGIFPVWGQRIVGMGLLVRRR